MRTMRDANLVILPCDDFAAVAPGDGRVLARYFDGIAGLIREHGGDPDAAIAAYGIDPHAFADPQRHIECTGALRMIEELGRSLADPLFGLHLAARQDAEAYGYLAPLCRAARDVRQAIDTFVTYVPLVVTPEGMFQLIETDDRIEIRWDCDSELRQNRQGSLHGAGILLKLLRSIIGEDFRPDGIVLPAFGAVQHQPELSAWFDCEVRSTPHRHGAILVSRDYLSRPAAASNAFVFAALERPLAAIKRQIEHDLSARVGSFIRAHLHRTDCNVEQCAAALGTSVRTLQKHLARMGSSFTAMLEAEKCEVARAALHRSEVSLDELAFQLGYAEQSTFGRAFRRWTGMSPGEYRRSARRPAYRSAGNTLAANVSA